MKKIISFVLCLVIGMSLIACNVQPRMGSGDIVLATSASGGHELLLRDYLYFLGSMRSQNENMLHQFFGLTFEDFEEHWSDPFDETGRTMFDNLKDSALEEVKETIILYSIARERGYTYDRDDIAILRTDISNFVMNLNSPERTGERMFYELNYVTYQEILESLKMLATIDAMRTSIHESIDVSDELVYEFYNDPENHDVVEDQRGLTVAHILLSFDDEAYDEEANREEVLEQASVILARIEAGESFASLVETYSQDPGSLHAEGQYVITRNTNFVPEFLEWTLEAEIGDLGIVETFHGVHIMNLVHRETFDDMLEERENFDTNLPPLADVIRGNLFTLEIERLLEEHEVNDWEINAELFNSIDYSVYARQGR